MSTLREKLEKLTKVLASGSGGSALPRTDLPYQNAAYIYGLQDIGAVVENLPVVAALRTEFSVRITDSSCLTLEAACIGITVRHRRPCDDVSLAGTQLRILKAVHAVTPLKAILGGPLRVDLSEEIALSCTLVLVKDTQVQDAVDVANAAMAALGYEDGSQARAARATETL